MNHTAQKMKFYIKDFFNKCDKIPSFLGIWSHLLKKSWMENFPFCAMNSAEAMYKIANKLNDLSNENSLGKIDKIVKTVDYL